MSRLYRIDPHGVAPARTGWRFFPWFVAGGIGLTMLVNFAMMWMAVQSFPGLATHGGFATSNAYDRVLHAAQQQAALGWTVQHTLAAGRPVVILSGPEGGPLAGATLTATAERPLGETAPTLLVFHETAPGRFEADTPLALGKWAIDLTVSAQGHEFHTVRRLVVK